MTSFSMSEASPAVSESVMSVGSVSIAFSRSAIPGEPVVAIRIEVCDGVCV